LSNFGKTYLLTALKEKVFHNDSSCNKELEELSRLFVKREYPRKKTLVAAGEKWDKIFFIHQGMIRLFYTDKEGKEFNKGFFHEGHFTWPVAPSARKNDSLFSIAALEAVKISVCPFESFFAWLLDHGYWEKFALPYAELLAEEKFFREYEFLITSATERFQKFCIDNPTLAKRIPDYHLASYLGITNVSLSRIKKRINFNLC
jgi:CRP-like cAMP-binding protein